MKNAYFLQLAVTTLAVAVGTVRMLLGGAAMGLMWAMVVA